MPLAQALLERRRLSDSRADCHCDPCAVVVESTPRVTVRFRDRPVDICQGHCETTNLLAAPDDPSPRSLATDSTMSSAGVSELMDAEKKASTVVAEARAALPGRVRKTLAQRRDRLRPSAVESRAAIEGRPVCPPARVTSIS